MRNIRVLHISGGGRSYTITVPPWLVKELRWRSGQKVVLKKRGEGILISDWKPKSKKAKKQ